MGWKARASPALQTARTTRVPNRKWVAPDERKLYSHTLTVSHLAVLCSAASASKLTKAGAIQPA